MRLYDDIFKNPNDSACARCVIVPGGGGYFEGVKSVGDFSSERLVLYFSGDCTQSVEVEGKNFIIGKYCDGDLQLFGAIARLRLPQNEKHEENKGGAN